MYAGKYMNMYGLPGAGGTEQVTTIMMTKMTKMMMKMMMKMMVKVMAMMITR